jgi:mandelamide amidase
MSWMVDEQLALTATEDVISIQSGRLIISNYIVTLPGRAGMLSTLNAFTMLNTDGALAAAKRIDALSID